MTPAEAVDEARAGKLRPVYLVLGEEPVLAREALTALRLAALQGGVPGLNEDRLVAGEVDVDGALSAARTLPMMAKRRLVQVTQVERWDQASKSKADGEKPRATALDRLADYVKEPSASTVLLLAASKLDQRRRLVTVTRAAGALVDCSALSRHALPRWIADRVRDNGQRIAPHVAALIAELAGPELGPVADAVERLALYTPPGGEVSEDAVGELVVRLRPATVWQLTDAVARRDAPRALMLLHEVLEDPRDAVQLVGSLAYSARQLIRFEAARAEGASASEAAQAAGAPPFKAGDLDQQIKLASRAELERWLELLADVDRALKGGSKRPPRAVLEYALLRWCRPGRAAKR